MFQIVRGWAGAAASREGHVRKLIGYDRYDTQAAVDAMNDLYRGEWRLFCNLFLPCVKLERKIRIGAKIKRVYSKAQAPLDRLLASEKGDRTKLEKLRRLRETLNPFELSAVINTKLAAIWALASKVNLRSAEKPRPGKKPYWQRPGEYELPTNVFLPLRNITISHIRQQWSRESRLNRN